ncbi:MAG: fibronectin type III domain-containing protein, partial [Stackebrandtia sp.]
SSPEEDDPAEETDDPQAGEDGDGGGDLASLPTKFGAWWADDGKYEGKWAKPADDGGHAITGYLITDCADKELKTVDASTYKVTVEIDKLTCMSVQAVTEIGAGEPATFPIEK